MAKTKIANKAVHAPGEPVYTVMAFITFVALALGCTLLYLDYDEYGKQQAPTEKVPTLSRLGEANAAVNQPAPTPTPNPMTPMPMMP